MARILHLTDPHVVLPPDLVANTLATFDLLKTAIDQILAKWEEIEPIDAIIVSGDITDKGDLASYHAFRCQIERLPAPFFLIPGNHDEREAMRECFADIGFMPREGKINWLHDLADLRLIGLDTLVPHEGGGILDEAALAMLADAIRKDASKPTLIAMHHPPFASGIWFMDKIGLEGVERLRDVLDMANCDIRIICGHVHSTMIGQLGKHVAISGPSVASAFAADYRNNAPVGFNSQPVGFMIHDWNDGFRSTCIPLNIETRIIPF